MIEYTVRVDAYCEIEWTRDDNGVTRVQFRDRCSRTVIELPDVHGPDLALQLVNGGIREIDGIGYGREVITPESLARTGGGE